MRDLQKDLEIIQATTPGKWEDWDFDCLDNESQKVGLWITVGKFPGEAICTFGVNPTEQDYKNAKAIVEAHNGGWEEAIQRAMAAEAWVQELKDILRQCVEALELCSHEELCRIAVAPYDLLREAHAALEGEQA